MAKLFQIPKVQGVTKATAKQQMLKQIICSDAPEQALRYRGVKCIAGVDEVGRGALFGPVVAAAVILPPKNAILQRMGLKDSKQLTREEREKLDRRIRKSALAIGLAAIDAETIDRINIYHATRLAMLRAVEALGLTPDHVLIDAMLIDHPCPQTKLFYGDALCLSIAAASVIAKVHRDNLMRDLDRQYPQYGLAQHKGYATPEHRKALAEHGPTPLHRRSFNFVAESDPDALLEDTVTESDLYEDDLADLPSEVLDHPTDLPSALLQNPANRPSEVLDHPADRPSKFLHEGKVSSGPGFSRAAKNAEKTRLQPLGKPVTAALKPGKDLRPPAPNPASAATEPPAPNPASLATEPNLPNLASEIWIRNQPTPFNSAPTTHPQAPNQDTSAA